MPVSIKGGRRPMREKTYRTALGGILSALALSFLFMGSVLPFAEIAGPALASVCVLLTGTEFSVKAAFAVYSAVSVLGLIIVPDKESVLLFIFFLGWFPIFKMLIDGKLRPVPVLLIKLAVFNASVLLMYWLILKVFVMDQVAAEFSGYSPFMYAAVIILSNITVIILDFALSKIVFLYTHVWRKKLVR